jgi:outer membrane protein assembly factor BamB
VNDGWVLQWGVNLGPGAIRGGPDARNPTNLPPEFSMGRATAITRLLEENARPATDVIFAGNKAWVNGFDDMVVVDLDTGRVTQRTAHVEGRTQAEGTTDDWQGAALRGEAMLFASSKGGNGPADAWIFGNRLNRAASLIGGRVYCVEDNYRASLDLNVRERQVQVGNAIVKAPQPCGNTLTAYDAGTGSRLWRVGRAAPAAPVASGTVWDVSFADGIAVDGRLDDWQGRGLEIPVACTNAGAGQTWPGATIGLAWNNTGLLVRADVVDTDIQEVDAVSNLWSGDSIEMFLADRCGGTNSIQVVAGTGADPRYKETRRLLYDRRSSAPSGRANAAVEATVAGAPAPRGYRFEALLPWSDLGIRPRPGCEVGFQIYVNNAASNRAPMAARFYPQGGTFADTRLMHTLRLTDADDKQRIAAPEPAPSKTQAPWRANTIRFAAVPVPCADLLLTPIEDDSGLSVVGLDADSGAVVWRTRLAYGPACPTPRTAPMNVTVEGATAYLCPGNGSVTCLDGCDGDVLWTTLYEPPLASSATYAANEANGRVEWTGDDDESEWQWAPGVNTAASEINVEVVWDESLALVAGETVVALPEDSSEILAFNRRTGAPLWARRKPDDVTYVVGRQGARLIVAGTQTVACVDLTDGREQWRTSIGGSTGRGALCGPEVLIPSGRTILRLRVKDGTKAGQMQAQTLDGWPMGNLYANGDRLLVAGPEQLYALIPSRPVFARLAERLAREPSAQTYAERGRLYAGIERYAEAVADLREAWKRSRGTAGEEAIRSPLLNALWSAAERDAGAAKAFYAEAFAVATTATERAESTWRLAQCLERTGDTNEALARYADLLAAADASITPTLGDADWTVSTRRLAAQRIRVLRGEDAAKGRALLDAPAAQALARLGPAAAWTALVEVATFFPDAEAGREAALKAAQLAVDRGDWGIAETILQRALALSARSNRVVIAGELVKLYERMKWPQGIAQLRNEWPASDAGERTPEFLKLAATNAAALPLPPWRLRWRKTLDTGTGFLMVPAGAFYWNNQTKQIGCLTLETGQPRWQTNGTFFINQTALANEHLLTLCGATDSRAWVDVWSGVLMTNGVYQSSRLPDRENHSVLIRNGLMTTGVQGEGGLLTSMDVLTGQVIWRRTDMESLLGLGAVPYPTSTAEGLVFVGKVSGQTAQVLTLDPWTGAIVTRRTLDQHAAWTRFKHNRAAKRWSPAALDVGSPVLEKQQLTAKNLRRGGTAWTSPPELAIVKYQILNEMVLAQTEEEELVLLNGETGRVLQRSQGEPFTFDYATAIGDAVIAFRQMGDGTNEVLVLDPAVTGIAFRCRLSAETMQPRMTLGPALPGQLLVNVYYSERVKNREVFRSCIQVIDGKGNNPNGWRLPRNEEIRDTGSGYATEYVSYFTPNVILVVGQGEVLAYEHDPGDGGKKP